MGEIGYQILNITNPLPTSPPPIAVVNPPPQEPKLPMEDYILLGVVTGLLFTLYFGPIISYGCFIILRRLNQYLLSHRRQSLSSTMMSPPLSHGGSAVCLVSSFKFMKGEEGDKTQLDSDTECSICLSDFEDGEEVRKLPMCDHCFHAYCIDRWLFSHFDCPLCRAPVVEPPPPPSG